MKEFVQVSGYNRRPPHYAEKVKTTKRLEAEVYGKFDYECCLELDVTLASHDFSEATQ